MSQSLLRRKKFDEGAGEDPDRYIVGLYTRYLQGLFNFMPSGHFHWEPDREHTEIIITAEAPLDLSVVEKAPAITVVLGPTQWAGIGIDNMLSYDPLTGERIRTDLCTGFFAVYCVAGNDVVARRLGQAVANHTRVHQRLLESAGGFFQIARPACTIAPPAPPGQLVNGDAKGLTMVQVSVPYSYQWAWKTTPNRQSPQDRSLAMILQEERAVDYPYSSPQQLQTVQLAISTRPMVVRRWRGSRLTTSPVGEAISPFQLLDLRSFPSEEP